MIDGDLPREQTCRYVYMSMNTNSCCGTWWKKPVGRLGIGIVSGLFVYMAVFHWHYVAAYWPFLIFLACPLSHLFMHHGHGGGHDESSHNPSSDQNKSDGKTP
jgi:hypothetical protein